MKIIRKIKRIIILIILCVILFSFFEVKIDYKNLAKYLYKCDYSEYVEAYSKLYEVEEAWIYAIIKNESNFNKDAKSNVGAVGLMQIMKSTADDVAKELELENYNLYLPEDNIKIGTKYFSDLLKKYNEPSLALAAYNAGFGNVDTWINSGVIKNDGTDYENIPYKETNMYVRKILRDYNVYVYIVS